MKRIIVSTIALATLSGAAYAQNVKDLEKRIEDLEFSNYEKYFSWSGSLENRFDSTTSEEKKPTITNKGTQSYFETQLMIDMMSRPSDKLSFFGRLSMRKLWNDGSYNAAQTTGNNGGDARGNDGLFTTWGYGRERGTAAVYVERAFMNYQMMPSLTFTIGRLPTIDGMPKHITSASPTLGSYPTLAFSAILDGMALTHGAKVGGGDLKTRFIYTPLQFANYNANPTNTSGRGIGNTNDTDGKKVSTNNLMYSFMLDYTKGATKFARNTNLILQWVNINEAFFGASTSSTLRLTNQRLALYAEFAGIAGTGFDFAAQFAMSKSESEGKLSSVYGVYCNESKCDVDGNSYILTAKYNFGNFALGYEYINHDKNSFAYDVANRGPLNIYGTAASNTHHMFANWKIDNNLKMVFGYQMQQIDELYTYGLFGKGTASDVERTNFYTRLIANF